MRIRFRPGRRCRALWVAAALCCLLFQQLAMAAYACPPPPAMADMAMTTGACAAMAPHHGTHADPRCIEHCAGHVPAQAGTQTPTVPAPALPSASPLQLGTVASTTTRQRLPDPAQQSPEAPPPLRFCTLLI